MLRAEWNTGDLDGEVSRPTLSLRQGHQHLHVAEGEEARLAMEHALVPVLVDLVGQRDDVALMEAQLPIVLGLKVIECLAAWLVQGRWGWAGYECKVWASSSNPTCCLAVPQFPLRRAALPLAPQGCWE